MEAVASILAFDPIITRGQQLVQQYRTWKGNKEKVPELCNSLKTFERELTGEMSRLQEEAASLPEESRRIIENDIVALTECFTSARIAVEKINKSISRNRMLQFFRANALGKECDTFLDNLEEARKILRDVNKHVDVRCAVQGVNDGQKEIVDTFHKSIALSSTCTRRSTGKGESDVFHAYYDVPYDTSKLVFNFDAKDEHGKPSSQEGKVLELLLDESPDINREVDVQGIGGVGKTSLLRGIRGSESVKKRFEDGIYNISIGMDGTHVELIESLSRVVERSGGDEKANVMRGERDMKKVMNIFRSWFAKKRCLFVVDDVWETKEIPMSSIHELMKVHIGGGGSKVVLTTRSGEIASEAERYLKLEPRGVLEYESRSILLKYSGIEAEERNEDDMEAVNKILEHCSGLPLFLAVSGKMVRTLSFRHGHGGCVAYHVYAEELESSMQSLLCTSIGDYERLSTRLMISMKLLEERKQYFDFRVERTMGELHRRLSVMTRQMRVPMKMLKELWELEDEIQTARVAREFEQVGLCDVEFEKRGNRSVEILRLHDSIYNFSVSESRKHGEESIWHETLIRRYNECLNAEGVCGEWWESCLEPDGYIHENVCRHLLEAGRGSEAVKLVLKPQWAERQVNVNGVRFLKQDLWIGMKAIEDGIVEYNEKECSEMKEALELISDTITLSSPFISENESELWFQLHGRLKRHGNRVRMIGKYVEWMETKAERPLTLCVNDVLGGAGGANMKIISVGNPILRMAVFDDGKRVACGDVFGFIYIVNIYESKIERKWKGHEDNVWAVSVGRNGTRLVSGSKDGSTKVWDLASGECLTIFEGHTSGVHGVEVMRDGKRVVSVSEDGTAQIWEMDSGQVVAPPFTGHQGGVYCVGVLEDRDEIITGGEDEILRVWSRTSGEEVGDPFEGHEDSVVSVSVTPDGRRILSESLDGTVRMWDLATHKQVMNSFKADSDRVSCVSMSRDGFRIVCGLYDNGTIHVWDSESGTQVCDPLEGHGHGVYGVSFLGDVDSIVSCSVDGTIRVWDTRRKRSERVSDRHKDAVAGVSFTPNGKFVVSASYDQTLRIWDATTGEVVGDPLKGQFGLFLDVTITPDGKWIVSVSEEKTVDVWDLRSRELVHTLTGHTDEIWCVAVTPKGDLAVTGSKDMTV